MAALALAIVASGRDLRLEELRRRKRVLSITLPMVSVMTGMQYKRKQQARGHAAGEGDQGWDSQQ